MSIAILGEVYNETRRLAIAGSGLANGDFRLKKLIAPLEKAGKKSPVFAKVAAAIQNTIEADTKSASAALLELSTLVTAILYTQGKTGADGKLKAIETSEFEIPTANSSARVLKPLIEALTTTGSGRQEIITDAHRRGAFKDLRLVKPALQAIDDVYGEIAEFVAQNVLPAYGKAILPELREAWQVKGNAGHVRRLQLMHRIDPEQLFVTDYWRSHLAIPEPARRRTGSAAREVRSADRAQRRAAVRALDLLRRACLVRVKSSRP